MRDERLIEGLKLAGDREMGSLSPSSVHRVPEDFRDSTPWPGMPCCLLPCHWSTSAQSLGFGDSSNSAVGRALSLPGFDALRAFHRPPHNRQASVKGG